MFMCTLEADFLNNPLQTPFVITFLYMLALFVLTLVSFLYYYVAFMGLFSRGAPTYHTKNFPKVSVHIPVYNDPIAVRCVQAALNFDYPDFEVIVIDDSNDGKTSQLLSSISHPRLKYLKRQGRKGFKAGALNDALKISTGEIIVVFDSDFVPPPDFLKRIVAPFEDPSVGYVQARWSFENPDENLITVFASSALAIYHHFFYPFQNKIGAVFLSGAAMAIRREALERAGKWREGVLAEDAELTYRLNAIGYRGVYLSDLTADNQVPFTLSAFLRQQMRWSAGMIEALRLGIHHLRNSKLSLSQKLMFVLIPLLNLSYPFVALLLTASMALFLLDVPVFSPTTAALVLLLLSGYVFTGFLALSEEGLLRQFPRMVLSAYIIGPLLAFTNTYAILRLFLGGVSWYRTPKRVVSCTS